MDLDLIALGDELHRLPDLRGGVAHHAGELLEHRPQWHHAQRPRQILQLADDRTGVRDLAEQRVLGTVANRPLAGDQGLRDHGLCGHQLVHEVGEAVEPIDPDADRGFLGLRPRLGNVARDYGRKNPVGGTVQRYRFGVDRPQRHVTGERLEQREVALRNRQTPVAMEGARDHREERLEHVSGLQRQVGAPPREGDLPVAHAAQQRLGVMCARGNARQPQEARRPLHGVKGAEHPVHRLRIRRVPLEGQQRRFRVCDALAAFFEELSEQVAIDVVGQAFDHRAAVAIGEVGGVRQLRTGNLRRHRPRGRVVERVRRHWL